MTSPRYQEVARQNIPTATSPDGLAQVRVIAGTALGIQAVIDTHTPMVYHDWTIQPGGQASIEVAPEHNVGVYVFSGNVMVGSDGQKIEDGQLAVLTDGTTISVAVAADEPAAARFLVLGGVPHAEPVARYGPFVMNTQEELEQAFADYRNGRMGKIELA